MSAVIVTPEQFLALKIRQKTRQARVCPVCGGAGFVQAAPLSTPPTGRGGDMLIGRDHGFHRKALWSRALTVPCWVCGGAT